MRIRPYREGDIEHIIRRPHDDYGPESFEHTKQVCENNITYTFEHDSIPVAIFGVQLVWTGVAHVWTVISDGARGHGIELTKLVLRLIDDYTEANDIRRLEALIKTDTPENIKWVKLLGFEYECTHFGASPEGGNLEMYVRKNGKLI